VAQLIAAHPEASDRKIGRLAGVDGKTVAALRKLGAEIETPHTPQTPQRGIPHLAETPHLAEIETPPPTRKPFAEAARAAEFETPQRGNGGAENHPKNSVLRNLPAENLRSAEIRAAIDNYLVTAPVEEIAAKVPRGPRRTALRNALRAPTPTTRLVDPLPGNNWRHKTTPEQRHRLLELIKGGATVMDAAITVDMNYGTARSQVKAASRETGRAA
jgi:hypothetical protein